jgi:hypothetical protein
MSAFPSHRSVPSIPVSQDIALKYLQTYLEATKSSPYLLPNARLEPSGPTADSSDSSVTIYNLKRVEAGLRGEWLAPTLDLEDNTTQAANGLAAAPGNNADDQMETDGWQDLDEYQREQQVMQGGEGPIETADARDEDSELDSEVEGAKPDKKPKKEEKKLRSKEEKRKRRDKKQKESEE